MPGTTVDIRCVPELVPEEVARNSHYKKLRNEGVVVDKYESE